MKAPIILLFPSSHAIPGCLALYEGYFLGDTL